MSSARPATADRLVAVDGLRGIAAFCVAMMHAHIGTVPVLRGYLAVDFFFVLSGFVIARAYEPRFAAGLSLRDYAWQRIERLYPLLAIGSLLGMLAWLAGLADWQPTGQADLWLGLAGQLTMVPFLSSASSLAFDAALWSISFEIFANLLHAAMFPRLDNRKLALLIGGALLALALLGHRYGSLNIGWSRESSAGGMARVIFGFFLGVALSRGEALWRPRLPQLPFAAIGVALLLVVNAPIPLHGHAVLGTAYDLLAVMVMLPLLVMLGINARGGGRAALFLGVMSFPIYAVHVPLVDAMRHAGWSNEVRIAGVCLIGLGAWALGRYVDEPLNAWRRAARRRARPRATGAALPAG